MAAPTSRKIIRAPGRLILTPTNLSSAYPYGGTELGIHRDVEIEFNERYYFPTAEEFGHVPIEGIYCGGSCVVRAFLRGLDDDAVKKAWPFTGTGGTTGSATASFSPATGSNRAGKDLASSLGFKLLFAPRAADAHPFVVLYRAIPALDEAARMPMSLAEEVGVAVAYRAIPDATGRMFMIGRRQDLSL